MFGEKFISFVRSFGLLLAVLVLANAAAAQTKVQGLITGRSGATMMVRTQDGETVVVALTPETQVDEVEGLFHLRRKEMGLTALIPGLPVQVKGSMTNYQLLADTVKFNGSDLKTAEDLQAGLTPTEQQVSTNQSNIQANERQIAANGQQIATNQENVQANQKKIATNQSDIIATNKRFQELGEYNVLGKVTVYFGNGKVIVDPQYCPQLLALAQKAMTINGYIIQVQGYASAVGSAALNQKLSMERGQCSLFPRAGRQDSFDERPGSRSHGHNRSGSFKPNCGRAGREPSFGRPHFAEQGNRRNVIGNGFAGLCDLSQATVVQPAKFY